MGTKQFYKISFTFCFLYPIHAIGIFNVLFKFRNKCIIQRNKIKEIVLENHRNEKIKK